ncbi:hypothetical protein NQ314_001873 [Rhamnusium bicolor]|uniref:Uncharacterized protein n=1 Tax=Rhamnusium bicolor TaxID=1586634 RepID=A0AAV8ZRL7_9CUCU|nr:hypothetical protein NQ314_001873 [Rhamnusium bicolor]
MSLLFQDLKKQDTVMRESIPPEERLIATLRYLATGQSYESLKFSTGVAPQTLGYIISETCMAICTPQTKFI